MVKKLSTAFALGVGLMVACVAISAEKEKKKEYQAKCPVSGKDANKDVAVDYKEGKVYLCCEGCPDAFKKDTAKFAVQANIQLVGTKQAKQKLCPIAGKKLNPETAIEIEGVKVSFCCNGCKGKVEKAEGDAKLALVFGDEAFDKAFKVGGKKKDKKD
jgi:hypothetical protein